MKPLHVPIHEPDGTPSGATFAVERVGGATTIRYDSRGTTAGTRGYRRGMVLLLQRLGERGVTITDAAIETKTTAHLSRADRRLPLRPPLSFPIEPVATEADAEAVRAGFHTAAARAGRAPGAKGGGNGTKRLRLYLRTELAPDELERLVSG